MKQYTAAVIGLGQIGLGYDLNISDSKIIFTHCKAYQLNSSFHLKFGVDPVLAHRNVFEKYYQAKALSKISSLENSSIDCISVAVPHEAHTQTLLQSIELQPKVIICEKPFTLDLEQAKKIVALANHKKIYIIVNYMRRFEPCLITLKNHVMHNTLGNILGGYACYSKDFYSNASHLIDICHFIIPNQPRIQVHNHRQKGDHKLIDFSLDYTQFRIDLKAISSSYHLLELTLFTEKGKVVYADSGLNILYYQSKPDPILSHASTLQLYEKYETELACYQKFVVQEAEQLLNSTAFDPSYNLRHLDTQRSLAAVQKELNKIKEDRYEHINCES